MKRGLAAKDWLLSAHESVGFERASVIAHVVSGEQIHHTEHLSFRTPKRYALINIQDEVEAVLKRSGVRDGIVFVGAMHITASIYVNDAESGLLSDIAEWIEAIAPYGRDYAHHATGEDNGDAHLKSILFHPSVTLPVTGGKLDFGTWQRVFYAEFDGERSKRVIVKAMGIASRE